MVKHKYNRMWKGERVTPGTPVEGTDKERQALLDADLAYKEVSRPNSNSTVKEIKAYLDAEGIEYESGALKDELLELC